MLAPIVLGMTLNRFTPGFVKMMLPVTPVIGVASTCLLVGSAVAQVSESILKAGWKLQVPMIALHLAGGLAGYVVPAVLGFDEVSCRTMAIETAMKSSAFGFLLAKVTACWLTFDTHNKLLFPTLFLFLSLTLSLSLFLLLSLPRLLT